MNCFLCDGPMGAGEFHTLTSPDKSERHFCLDCMGDFYHYVNSGQADKEKLDSGLAFDELAAKYAVFASMATATGSSFMTASQGYDTMIHRAITDYSQKIIFTDKDASVFHKKILGFHKK